MTSNYLIVNSSEYVEWGGRPKGMPEGYEQAVVVGDPRTPELFIFRARIPSGWRAMPHFHPADEHITVLEGECFLGIGSDYDEENATRIGAGGFSTVTRGTVHFFFAKRPCMIQVHGIGPQRINYLRSGDDPRASRPAPKEIAQGR